MEDERPTIVRAEEMARDAEHAKKKGRFAEAAELHTSTAELFGLVSRSKTNTGPKSHETTTTLIPRCTAQPTLQYLIEYHQGQAEWAKAVMAEILSSLTPPRTPTPQSTTPPDASNLLTSFFLVNHSRPRFSTATAAATATATATTGSHTVNLTPSPSPPQTIDEGNGTSGENLEAMITGALTEGGPKTRAVIRILVTRLEAATRRCKDLERRIEILESSSSSESSTPLKSQPSSQKKQHTPPLPPPLVNKSPKP